MTVDQLIAALQALPPEQRALPAVVKYTDFDWEPVDEVDPRPDGVRISC